MNAFERTETLTIRIAQEEKDMLRAVAERDGLSLSDWLRLTIRRAHADAFGASKPKRTKGTK